MLQDLNFIVQELILLVLLVLLVGAEVLVFAVGSKLISFLLDDIWLVKLHKRPRYSPVALIVLPPVFFVFSLATLHFITFFILLLLAVLTVDVGTINITSLGPFLWSVEIIFFIFQFISMAVAGGVASSASSKFRLLHSLGVGMAYLAVIYLYDSLTRIADPFPAWVRYFECLSVIVAVLLGGLVESATTRRSLIPTTNKTQPDIYS
jgi:hypothetical protein